MCNTNIILYVCEIKKGSSFSTSFFKRSNYPAKPFDAIIISKSYSNCLLFFQYFLSAALNSIFVVKSFCLPSIAPGEGGCFFAIFCLTALKLTTYPPFCPFTTPHCKLTMTQCKPATPNICRYLSYGHFLKKTSKFMGTFTVGSCITCHKAIAYPGYPDD
jgi:hypothetical protein